MVARCRSCPSIVIEFEIVHCEDLGTLCILSLVCLETPNLSMAIPAAFSTEMLPWNA